MASRFLVTGGTGQIGAYVCESLLEAGHQVLCYDYKPNYENIASISKRMEVVNGDINDADGLVELVKSNRITQIIHLAASLVLDSMQSPRRAYQTNIMGTNNILEAARTLGVERTVFASSISVYGSPISRRPGIVDEDDYPNCPHDPYSTTKLAAELMGSYYRDAYGVNAVCLRLAAVWGPGRYGGYTGQFNDFIRRVAIGESPKFPEDFAFRDAKMRWFYVKDAGRCFANVAQAPWDRIKRHLYNAGLQTSFTGRDLVEALKRIFPDASLEFTPTGTATKLSSTIAGPSGLDIDCSRLYEDVGFSPSFTFDDAVKDMVSFERARAGLPPIR